jgi:hypothetical protein
MRNRKTTETILAHIDDPSIDFIRPFLKIDPYYADIYVIGGMYSFKDTVHRILLELQKNHYYHLTFCHIIDNESNDFAIDCRNGETWLNSEVGDLPYTEKEEGDIEMFSKFRMYFQKELNKKR